MLEFLPAITISGNYLGCQDAPLFVRLPEVMHCLQRVRVVLELRKLAHVIPEHSLIDTNTSTTVSCIVLSIKNIYKQFQCCAPKWIKVSMNNVNLFESLDKH